MYDLVVYGASGFTGGLVAEYLQSQYGSDGAVSWAVAGRSEKKLAELHARIEATDAVDIIVADAGKPATLAALARQSRVVLTTVGPYQFHGEPLLQACIEAGCDYVDLCGEVGWMSQMIEQYETAARASRARIVFSCGYDSVPFDLGVFRLQQLASERCGQPATRVRTRIRDAKGEMSGGTIASGIATFDTASKSPAYRARLEDPFTLVRDFSGPGQPDGDKAYFDEAVDAWVAPFEMASINTRNIHRSNALLGHSYGEAFRYDEMVMTGSGRKGKKKAHALARQARLVRTLLGLRPLRSLLQKTILAKPGEGPRREERDAGYYDIVFFGHTDSGERLTFNVQGDEDPGYGSTSKMITECALTLAHERRSRDQLPGGIWTPASALGDELVARLEKNAGMRFMPDADI